MIIEEDTELIKEYERIYPKKHAIWQGKITNQFLKWKKKNKNRHQIQETVPLIKKILFRLDSIEERLNILENIKKNIIPKKAEIEISKNQFLRIIKTAYDSIEKKLGDFISIFILTEKVKETIPLTTEQIHSELYNLFMDYKIDLQTGKKINGEPLLRDGNTFVWVKFKEIEK